MRTDTLNTAIIKVKKIRHRDEERIALLFNYDKELIEKIKGLPDRRYSQSLNCWHIPYKKKNWRSFVQLNISYKIDINNGTTDASPSESDNIRISSIEEPSAILGKELNKQDADILDLVKDFEPIVEWNNRYFIIRMHYVDSEVNFVKGLAGSWWDKHHKVWKLKATQDNLKSIQSRWVCFSSQKYGLIFDHIERLKSPAVIQLYVTPQYPDQVVVKLHGYRIDMNFIKSIADRQYDQENRRWLIPYDQELIDRIKAYYVGKGAKIIDRMKTNIAKRSLLSDVNLSE